MMHNMCLKLKQDGVELIGRFIKYIFKNSVDSEEILYFYIREDKKDLFVKEVLPFIVIPFQGITEVEMK